MNAERESLEPATWSTLARMSDDSVIEVFSFILLLYYQIGVSRPPIFERQYPGPLAEITVPF